jgi:hypothetical protein
VGTGRYLWLDAWSGARRKADGGIIRDLEIAPRSGVVLLGS